ncbi:MAG: kynureninase [Alphaproteobacteria bacterium]|nr:kynureninase [Alphaproteobacteria bacterium]
MIHELPDFIRALDAADPVRNFRSKFSLPSGVIYLDGNSLGALPAATLPRLEEVVRQEWGTGLIRSWNTHDWIGASRRVGDKIAALVGASAGEVVVAESTSVNIFKLLMAAIAARPGRNVILSEAGNFPTDLYVAQGIAAFLPHISVRAAEPGQMLDAIGDDVAVVLLTHVHYKTGDKYDMAAITRRAHDHGALMIWDLCHSAGAVKVDLGAADADLALGCGYKYLNGGPGAPAFLYVAKRLQTQLQSPVTGWLGHAAPFAFTDDYRPAPDIGRFLSGTPPILGLTALETGIDLLVEAPRDQLYEKGQKLCSLFIELVERNCAGYGIEIATTRDSKARGSHVSLRHAHGYPIVQALIAEGVIGDFRAPDILRFGFTPLYLSYADVWRATEILRDILATGRWDDARFKARAAVT